MHSNTPPGRAPLKAELHAHTSECRKERCISYNAFELIDAAAARGFEVLAITNHDSITYTTYMRDYARERGIVLIPGIELTVHGKHVLAYNIPEKNLSACPHQLAERKAAHTMYIAPHPFFPARHSLGRYFKRWQPLFDAVELCHFYTRHINFNPRAIRAAAAAGLPLVGTSDCHSLRQLGTTYSLIDAEKDPEEIIKAVKRGAVNVVSAPLTLVDIISISRVSFLANKAQSLVAACRGLLAPSRLKRSQSTLGKPRRKLDPVPAPAEIRSRR